MKKSLQAWRRIAATLTDLSCIYSITVLTERILWLYAPIGIGIVFIGIFLLYYVLSYLLLAGRTPAKILCGLRLVGTREPTLKIGRMVTRELFCKTLIGIIVPLLLVTAIFDYRRDSTLPAFEVLRKGIALFIVLAISLAAMMVVKRTWWDVVSGTTMVKQHTSNKGLVRWILAATSILIFTSAGVVFYPFLEGKGNIKNSYFPKYPVSGEVKKYADFIRNKGQDPLDYVFNLFDRYDLVVISERMHPEYTQYQKITRIVQDPRFVKKVGNLFTECGSVSFQDTLNTLLRASFQSADSLDFQTALLQRNSNALWPLWDNTNLFDLFESVSKLNAGLPDSAKINWYFTDLPVDWRRKDHPQFVAGHTDMGRDSFMARQVMNRYAKELQRQHRHKALVIMNTRHGYGITGNSVPESFRKVYGDGTAAYLNSRYPDKVATVTLNFVSIRYGYAFTPIQQGKWDAAFSLLGNPDAAFDFSGSPLGDDVFDAGSYYFPSVTYKDVFTGFIFYKPLEEHFDKIGFVHEFDGFEDSVLRRASSVDKSLVQQFKDRIDRYEKDPGTLIYTEPDRYALLVNLLQLAPMLALVVLHVILSLILYLKVRFNAITFDTRPVVSE